MTITVGWRQGPNGLEKQHFRGGDVPDGWFDNPNLRPNTSYEKRNGIEAKQETASEAAAEPVPAAEPETPEQPADVDAPAGESEEKPGDD